VRWGNGAGVSQRSLNMYRFGSFALVTLDLVALALTAAAEFSAADQAKQNLKDAIAKISQHVNTLWTGLYDGITGTRGNEPQYHDICPANYTTHHISVARMHRSGLCYDQFGLVFDLDSDMHKGRDECQLTEGWRNGNTYDPNGPASFCRCSHETWACEHCCNVEVTARGEGDQVRVSLLRAASNFGLPAGGELVPSPPPPPSCDPGCMAFGPAGDECDCNVCGSSFFDRIIWVKTGRDTAPWEEMTIPGCKKDGDGSWAKGTSCDADFVVSARINGADGGGWLASEVAPTRQTRMRFSTCLPSPNVGDDVCDPKWTKAQGVPDCAQGLGPENGYGATCTLGTEVRLVDGKWLCVEAQREALCVPQGGDTCDVDKYGRPGILCTDHLPPIGGATCCHGLSAQLQGGKFLCVSDGA